MNNWLNQLERKYGRFGIPNLTNILVGGQILVFAIELFINRTITAWVGLSRYFLLHGQIWRLITFLFQPVWLGGALGLVKAALLLFFAVWVLQKLQLLVTPELVSKTVLLKFFAQNSPIDLIAKL